MMRRRALPFLFVLATLARAPAQFGAIIGSPATVLALWLIVIGGVVVDRVVVHRHGVDRLAATLAGLLAIRAVLSVGALARSVPGATSFVSAALSGALTVLAGAALYRRDGRSLVVAFTTVTAALAIGGIVLVAADTVHVHVPGHTFTMQVATNRTATVTPLGIFEDYSRVGTRVLRLQSFFDEPGTASMVFVPAAAIAVVARRRRHAAVLALAGALTFSLGAIAGLMFGTAVAVVRGRRGRWVAYAIGTVLGGLGTVLAIPPLTHYVVKKFFGGSDGLTSLGQRIDELSKVARPDSLVGSKDPISIGPLNQIRVLGYGDVPVEVLLIGVQLQGFVRSLHLKPIALSLGIASLTLLGIQRIDPLSFPSAALALYLLQRLARTATTAAATTPIGGVAGTLRPIGVRG